MVRINQAMTLSLDSSRRTAKTVSLHQKQAEGIKTGKKPKNHKKPGEPRFGLLRDQFHVFGVCLAEEGRLGFATVGANQICPGNQRKLVPNDSPQLQKSKKTDKITVFFKQISGNFPSSQHSGPKIRSDRVPPLEIARPNMCQICPCSLTPFGATK